MNAKVRAPRFGYRLKTTPRYRINKRDEEGVPSHVSFAIDGRDYRSQLIASGQLRETEFTPYVPTGQGLRIGDERQYQWPEHEFWVECNRQTGRHKMDIYGKEYTKNN